MSDHKKKSKSLDKEVKKTVARAESNSEHVELVNVLYNKLKAILKERKEKKVSVSNIIIIIDLTMKLAADYKSLTGLEKKAIVITVVKRLIEESDLSDEDEEAIKIIAERALDPAIDQLFAMAPEVYGKVKVGCTNLFRKCSKKN